MDGDGGNMGGSDLEIMIRAVKWFPRRFNFCLVRTSFRYESCHFYNFAPQFLLKTAECGWMSIEKLV